MNVNYYDAYQLKMELTLKNISQILMKQCFEIQNPGLLHGKMGLVVFFFHYAQFIGNSLFEEKALELMERIQQQIALQPDMDYANGLTGIGVGIEYLAQHGFIDNDTDDILEAVDSQVYLNIAFKNHSDVDSCTFLAELGRYLLFRIHNPAAGDHKISTLNHKTWLIHIVDLIEQFYLQQNDKSMPVIYRFLTELNSTGISPCKVKRLVANIKSISFEKIDILTDVSYRKNLERKISRQLKDMEGNSFTNLSPQLYGGLSGIGMYLLGMLNGRHKSWLQLL